MCGMAKQRHRSTGPAKELVHACLSSTDECILWPFGNQRYETIAVGNNTDRTRMYVHRFVCQFTHGPCPDDLHHAAHSCGNTRCVNPRHLRWSTVSENQLDRVLHGTDQRGERHPGSQLTEAQVLEAYKRSHAGERKEDIAAEYGVSPATIYAIARGTRWGWLTNPQLSSSGPVKIASTMVGSSSCVTVW